MGKPLWREKKKANLASSLESEGDKLRRRGADDCFGKASTIKYFHACATAITDAYHIDLCVASNIFSRILLVFETKRV